MRTLILLFVLVITFPALSQVIQNNPLSNHGNKFEQLGPAYLGDVNEYRTASGAPGNKYWQQRADYVIDATLNEKDLRLDGSETITYHNNSPDALSYIWLQLDENEHSVNGDNRLFDDNKLTNPVTDATLNALEYKESLKNLGCNIVSVTSESGTALPYTINQTMMRIDLPKSLKPTEKIKIKIKWNYYIANRIKYGGRGGYEFFPEDGNYLFTMAQWYPRLCVYSDYQGWNNKQFTGRGEFALTFGNFDVNMTVPADHLVCATGVCKNYDKVLDAKRLALWKKAQASAEPVEIATLGEAKASEKNKLAETKTWSFHADSVRDFAWGSSRKYIWDAMNTTVEGRKVMCMSFYPKEAYGLYRRFSTKTIAHTIKTYSRYTIPYPYPVAQSIEAANGMEYPMICFNFGRTEKDGTYSEATKYGMLGVIIHEVGHNFFPMIINSDERHWSWMDEGLNTFVQFLTEMEFDANYPLRRGPAHKIVDYMKLPKDQLEPIMSNSENIMQFGFNAYAKPATALNVLRETIMGRELFDFAFKEYCKRWAFKHPTPSDFFRTMEDASGVDLDWFWRGWFYGIEACDISMDTVKIINLVNNQTLPAKMDTTWEPLPKDEFISISQLRNKQYGVKTLVETDTGLHDFYYSYIENAKPVKILKHSSENMEPMNDKDFDAIKNKFIYEISFSNKGGLVMPIILRWNYKDGTFEEERISAYIWRKNEHCVAKTFAKDKEVKSVQLDPYRETADINESNNQWPKTFVNSRFDLFKEKKAGRGQSTGGNPMQKAMK